MVTCISVPMSTTTLSQSTIRRIERVHVTVSIPSPPPPSPPTSRTPETSPPSTTIPPPTATATSSATTTLARARTIRWTTGDYKSSVMIYSTEVKATVLLD